MIDSIINLIEANDERVGLNLKQRKEFNCLCICCQYKYVGANIIKIRKWFLLSLIILCSFQKKFRTQEWNAWKTQHDLVINLKYEHCCLRDSMIVNYFFVFFFFLFKMYRPACSDKLVISDISINSFLQLILLIVNKLIISYLNSCGYLVAWYSI